MGRSPTIQDLENSESEYRAYLRKLEDELSQRAAKEETDLQKRIDTFYSNNNYEKLDFISGKNFDFMQEKDWSLANVKSIIDAISKAVFGGSGKLPNGTEVENKTAVSSAITAASDLQLFIAGKCFDVLSGIIESFGSASSVTYNAAYKDVALGNGLHLFATVVCDSYKSTSFFDNEEIYQYLYIYQVKYSAQEAQTQAQIALTELYEDQIATFKQKSEDLLSQLSANKLTPEQYESSTSIYQTLIDQAVKKLGDLQQKPKVFITL